MGLPIGRQLIFRPGAANPSRETNSFPSERRKEATEASELFVTLDMLALQIHLCGDMRSPIAPKAHNRFAYIFVNSAFLR